MILCIKINLESYYSVLGYAENIKGVKEKTCLFKEMHAFPQTHFLIVITWMNLITKEFHQTQLKFILSLKAVI